MKDSAGAFQRNYEVAEEAAAKKVEDVLSALAESQRPRLALLSVYEGTTTALADLQMIFWGTKHSF